MRYKTQCSWSWSNEENLWSVRDTRTGKRFHVDGGRSEDAEMLARALNREAMV